ncbi:hypothetical protein BKA67DRAFT_319351 [Truncatella angustata]|uniref:Uncharacterized protein n=1 Tax=Truncatella angustata TaxID=152316 RepID=A0A9P8ZXW1_9PEZI|nr:uncharacterized protein BKA67DRAFT_319351 [Truncatella angustata]KAH6653389.1 hypothetical protein BKA67DRAFT_319351 [Truncatella angustata]
MVLFRKTATCLWLTLVPSTLAIGCIPSTAIAWPTSSGSSGSGSGSGSPGDTCSELCGNNPGCLELCEGTPGRMGRKLKTRASLSCTSSESCFMYTDGTLLCVDTDTGSFHDETGGSGNIVTGEYTSASEGKTTLATGQTASRTAGTAGSTATSALSRISISSSTSSTGIDKAASTSSTSATTTTATSGVERVRAYRSVGVLSFILSIFL